MYHHRIPCYGDLTPGIPDIENAAKSLAAFADNSQFAIPNSQLPTPNSTSCTQPTEVNAALGRWELAVGSVYACLRGQPRDALLTVARDFSPRVMRASEVEVLLDVSGLGRLIGPPREIERQLAHAMFGAGLHASVAIGPTQTIARLLAHADARDADRTSHLAPRASEWPPLPVEWLRELEVLPPAMNERDRLRPYETLQRWGIDTLGELAALPAADLSSRLGRRGLALQRLARGLDPRPFVPDAETLRFTARLELEWPIDALEPLSFVFARLLDPLSIALDRADRGAIAIRLELRLTDRSTFTRVLPLPAPMRDPRVLRTLLLLHLESNPPPAAIDIVSIELDPAPARITQFSLLERALPSPETLSTLHARLAALVGESRVGSAVLLDSHAPDAFAMARFAPAGTGGADRREGADGAGADRADCANGTVLRRQRTSVALRVSCERGRPVHIAASRRGVPYGAITEAAGPWRTSGNWWATPGAEPASAATRLRRGLAEARAGTLAREGGGWEPGQRAGAWSRDEWDVALKSGAVCRIYRDRTNARWFLEGIYD